MIETALIRRIDDLGRIVIPKEVRRMAFGTSDTDGKPMEIYYEKDGTIILKPYVSEEKIDKFEVTIKLMECFPQHSLVNYLGEFIAHKEANEYFNLSNCQTELDVKCKILEQLSRGAYKTSPYSSKKWNDKFHQFMRNGINKYLGTSFSEDDMEVIYTYLGNGCNRQKTINFIQSGYDMAVLKG